MASGKPDSDCLYGMYRMMEERGAEGIFEFWMDGDYPVYIRRWQLCRPSDDVEPPTEYKVEFIPEHFKIVELDITEGEELSVLCRGVGGAELAHLRLPPSAAFMELERQLREAMPPLGLSEALSLVNAKTGKLLKASAPTDSVMKVIAA
ncbi:unnamed protein product [Effrenium voratum]|nr:unnamed protein product [Effrenium voratum]